MGPRALLANRDLDYIGCDGMSGNSLHERVEFSWYEVMDAVRCARPRLHLGTGEPLHHHSIIQTIEERLRKIAADLNTADRLASYSDLDGGPELRTIMRLVLSEMLCRPVNEDELLVIPGVQAGLSYVQAVMRARKQRLLYPVGLEFPGAFDAESTLPPSTGTSKWSPDGVVNIDFSSLDWNRVGAVIISCPHSPTGRIWPIDDLRFLAEEATRHSAWLVIDETYGLPRLPLQVSPVHLLDAPNVVHLFSFSKVGLAAERVGVAMANSRVLATLSVQMRRTAISASRLGQCLAAHVLDVAPALLLGDPIGPMYESRWRAMSNHLASLIDAGFITVTRWEGGPFLWFQWAGGPDEIAVFDALMNSGLAVAPGATLHAEGHFVRGIRLGLGADNEVLEQAGNVIVKVVGNMLLKPQIQGIDTI